MEGKQDPASPAEALSAPYVLAYTYRRSVGPVIGRFLTGLRDGRIEGVRTAAGRVLVPPAEYDPETGAAVGDFVEVGAAGVVQSWCWVSEPRAGQPLDRPFAWALVKLDGADTAMVHAVDALFELVSERLFQDLDVRLDGAWNGARHVRLEARQQLRNVV